MTFENPSVNHADEGMHAARGGQNVRIQLVGTDKPLMTAAAIAVAIVALVTTIWDHEINRSALNDFSQWADLTYAREVQVDALLKAHEVDVSRLPPIQQPPARR